MTFPGFTTDAIVSQDVALISPTAAVLTYLLLIYSCFESALRFLLREPARILFSTVVGLAADISGRCPKFHRCSQTKTPHRCPLPLSSLLLRGIGFSLCGLGHEHISGNIQQRLARLPTLVSSPDRDEPSFDKRPMTASEEERLAGKGSGVVPRALSLSGMA